MKSAKKTQVQAENLLARLEDLVLGAPSSELRAASRSAGAVGSVRRIISEQLALNEGPGLQSSTRRATDHVLLAPAGRFGSTSGHARAVFGKDGTSAQDKVEELISSLSKDRKESKSSTKK